MFQDIIASLPAQQQASSRHRKRARSLAEQLAELKVMAQEARARKLDQSAAVKAKAALQSDQILANAVYQDLTAGDPDEAALRAYYDAIRRTGMKSSPGTSSSACRDRGCRFAKGTKS